MFCSYICLAYVSRKNIAQGFEVVAARSPKNHISHGVGYKRMKVLQEDA